MSRHEQFEVMCALAVTGAMNDAELRELERHLEACPDCRDRVADFAQISAQALPLRRETRKDRRLPQEMKLRFVMRARAEGILLAEFKPTTSMAGLRLWQWRRQAGFAAAVLLVMMAVGVSRYLLSSYLAWRPRSAAKVSVENVVPVKPNPVPPQTSVQASATVAHGKPLLGKTSAVKTSDSGNAPRAIAKTPATDSSRVVAGSAHPSFDLNLDQKRGDFTLPRAAGQYVSNYYGSNYYDSSGVFTGRKTILSNRFSSLITSPSPNSAAYGYFFASDSMGGPVLIASKSGGFSLHGSADDYFVTREQLQKLAWVFSSSRCRLPFTIPVSFSDIQAGFQKQDLTFEIDWRQRGLKTIAQAFPVKNALAADRGSFLQAGADIQKAALQAKNPLSAIDWRQRWLQSNWTREATRRSRDRFLCGSLPLPWFAGNYKFTFQAKVEHP